MPKDVLLLLIMSKVQIEVNDEAHYTLLDIEEITAKGDCG